LAGCRGAKEGSKGTAMMEAELKPDDGVSSTQLPDTTTPPPDSDLDSLLAEFDAKTAQPEPETALDPGGIQPQNDAPDQSWESLLGPDPKVAELQSQVDALQTEAHRAKELEAFSEFADDLQKQLPSWLPLDYAESKLRALAHSPELCLAFDLRNIDRKAANLELQKVQAALWQLQQNPQADPTRVQQLQQYGQRLEIAVAAPGILRKARLDIINEAAKLKPPIDEEVSGWRSEIAQSMRGASIPVDWKEPSPDFGKMDDATFKKYTLEHFGF
jgi:hypothetical protein